jgi:PAS domain S-box-containing protein
MTSDSQSLDGHAKDRATLPDPNATGASNALPGAPGHSGRETQERQAAWMRSKMQTEATAASDSEDDLIRMRAHRLFPVLGENVRDYAIFLMDVNGIIRFWGEGARLMKWWTKGQAEGAHLRMLYPDGGSEDGTAEDHLKTAAETGEYVGEGRRVRSNGSTLWAGITLTALRDDDGLLMGFAKVTRDLTAQRAAEAAALKLATVTAEGQRVREEVSRLRDLFVASVSHEIRTPLNALLGYVALLEGESRFPVTLAVGRIGHAIDAALSDIAPQTASKGIKVVTAVSAWKIRARGSLPNALKPSSSPTPRPERGMPSAERDLVCRLAGGSLG